MHTNRLVQEKSPYLQQHAHNPVDWHPWGDEAFARARQEEKPIFLSIGYSTCHWCHVMERESFESAEIAEVLNRHFVSIKVDREERPDVDRIYMQFVQATTGGGGWPMSVWLTPDLKPFFGGTYFPPDNRYGRPGFKYILEQLARAWLSDRAKIVQSSEDVLEQLKEYGRGASGGFADPALAESCFYQFRRGFDSKLGGFGGAPKFPRPSVHNFLLRYANGNAEHEATEMVLLTLREMAKGGMNDQLGGGFHRYSVDDRWFVPHFEKMLYDQAQLAISYLEAYQITHDESFARTAREIFEYVLRDMTDKDGGFYSAEDADSVIDPARPHEKGEGAFYIWSAQELKEVLGAEDYEWFARTYGVEDEGNVHNDPHGEFTGRNILYVARDGAVDEAKIADAKRKLLAARDRRVRPHLDDKILTAWNGLMISGFARGGFVLQEPRYLEVATRAAEFVHDRMYDRGSDVLLRRYRDGDAAIEGFLDDYAFYSQGLIDLYEAGGEERWLIFADHLTQRMRELFEDPADGGFFSTGADDPSLVMRMKEDYDGAEPSGNSIAMLNLLRLANVLDRSEYRESAERALRAFAGKMRQALSAVPQMMVALLYSATPPKQIVLSGSGVEELEAVIRARFLPWHELLRSTPETAIEKIKAMATDGPCAYVCENFTCQLPTGDPRNLAELLQ